MRNTTIHEVAKLAGVSTATVSRVLNQSFKVLPETRNLVLEAAQQLNYTPNIASRNLRKLESRILLVIVPTLKNPFYSEILAGMDACATQSGYKLLITAHNGSSDRERELIRMLSQRQADGVVLMSPTLSPDELQLLGTQFPVVQCCEYVEGINVPFVSVNNFLAFYEAAIYLIRAGHSAIAMCSSANNYISTRLREEGFRKAHADTGLPILESYIRKGSYSFESGYENAQVFLNMQPRPTAIMGVADVVAAGAISAIVAAGLSVPDDISVMGFDNLSMARMIQPTLSTISQPRGRLGRAAIELLLERISGNTTQPHELLLPHEIIIRHSTR